MVELWRGLPLFVQLLLVFLAAMYLTMSIAAAWSRRTRNRVRERLDEVRRERGAAQHEPETVDVADQERRRAAREAERRARRLIEEELARRTGFMARVARKLRRADVRLRVSEFLTFQLVAAMVLPALLMLTTGSLLMALVGAAAGLWLPHAYLAYRYNRRMRQFHDQLPDALTLMANALKSGYSFLQAADVVGREMPPPIGPEFSQVVR
ncbi:MAG TPA: type II secretion protein F, partial [Bacillota bacterium]